MTKRPLVGADLETYRSNDENLGALLVNFKHALVDGRNGLWLWIPHGLRERPGLHLAESDRTWRWLVLDGERWTWERRAA